MAEWFKLSTTLLTSPKIVGSLRRVCGRSELRFWRAVGVYLVLLSLNREGGCDGTLVGHYADSEFVRTRLGGVMDAAALRNAFDDLTRAQLIQASKGKRNVKIVGWDDSWRAPKSDADRSRAYRNRRTKKG